PLLRLFSGGAVRRRLDHVPRPRLIHRNPAPQSAAAPDFTGSICASTAAASASVNSSVFADLFIEQNFGPHIEQNAASLKPSSGNVSSCMERAVSGSSDSSN